MKIDKDSIVFPLPTDQLIDSFENFWKVKFPEDYKDFLKKYNGAVPETNVFTSQTSHIDFSYAP